MDTLPGGVLSAVQLHTLSVDLAVSLTDTMTESKPAAPQSWHAVTFPTYAAVRRTMTNESASMMPSAFLSAARMKDGPYSLPRALPAPPTTKPPAVPTDDRRIDRDDNADRSPDPTCASEMRLRSWRAAKPRHRSALDCAFQNATSNSSSSLSPARASRTSSSLTPPTPADEQQTPARWDDLATEVRSFNADRTVQRDVRHTGTMRRARPLARSADARMFARARARQEEEDDEARATASLTLDSAVSSSSASSATARGGERRCKVSSVSSDEMPRGLDGTPVMAGVLTKRGKRTRRCMQRHFVLTATTLCNFRSMYDVKPSWTVCLVGGSVFTDLRARRIVLAVRDEIGKRRFVLYGATVEETRFWADALIEVTQGARKRQRILPHARASTGGMHGRGGSLDDGRSDIGQGRGSWQADAVVVQGHGDRHCSRSPGKEFVRDAHMAEGQRRGVRSNESYGNSQSPSYSDSHSQTYSDSHSQAYSDSHCYSHSQHGRPVHQVRSHHGYSTSSRANTDSSARATATSTTTATAAAWR